MSYYYYQGKNDLSNSWKVMQLSDPKLSRPLIIFLTTQYASQNKRGMTQGLC